MRRSCHAMLPVGVCLAACLAVGGVAHGQALFPGPAAAPAVWDPAAVADYLLTGQTPHPAVARIVAPEGGGTSMGSGVLVDANATQGLVLTNWHVVRDARAAVLVQFPDGFQSAGTVVRVDEAWDLAAVVIWKPPATPVPLAAADPALGEPLTIAGFGRGAYREQTGPCTDYLSPGGGQPKQFVELQAIARQGDSGGAILNARRELAGVLFGQADGRTIGSCSTRVRAFLATAGSRGFAPVPAVGYAAVRAVDAAPAAGATAVLAAAPATDALERAMHVPGSVAAPPGLPAAPPVDSWSGFAQTAGPLALRLVRAAVADGHLLLSAAGGAALALFGVRVLFGGRRREA